MICHFMEVFLAGVLTACHSSWGFKIVLMLVDYSCPEYCCEVTFLQYQVPQDRQDFPHWKFGVRGCTKLVTTAETVGEPRLGLLFLESSSNGKTNRGRQAPKSGTSPPNQGIIQGITLPT
jgi:hypothetical protein